MGNVRYHPIYAVDYGSVETVGSGVVLGDWNNSTLKRYFEDSGSILVYNPFTGAGIPFGREIIAVRACHIQRNNGTLGLFNGWVMGFLRIQNKRQNSIRAYKQDGYNDDGREVQSPPLYKNNSFVAWTIDEISSMSTEVGSATGIFGPNTDNIWCACTESFIRVVYDEPVPVPNTPFPANGATVTTSSVNFSATVPAPQEEQPVRAVFQVARDSGFTTDVRTFIGGLNSSITAGTKSNYLSEVGKSSYTDLGPGTWYLRMKGRDMRGSGHESAWGATTSFSVVHGALPVPALSSPAPGSTSPTPYANREAIFTTQPTGDRKVGAGWRFSKDPTFATGVIQWQNRTGGFFFASAELPARVSYNPRPDPETEPGKDGGTVSYEDQAQYLTQGVWYAQVRSVDIYGQVGAWSSNASFTVSHPPVVDTPVPRNGAAFDQSTDPVSFKFTDPYDGDTQSALRMRVFDASMNLLQDTGKQSSSVSQAVVSIPNSHKETNLYHELTIWDADDVPSAPLLSQFKLSTAPIITLPFPALDEQIISGQPTITWSVQFATGGLTQHSFQIKFIQRNNSNVVHDTGVVVSSAMTWSAPFAILKNLINYQIQITVVDSQGLDGSLSRNFSTNFIRPEAFFTEVDGSDYINDGFVTVRWPSANPDGFFGSWVIYRRLYGTDPATGERYEWVRVGEVEDDLARSYRDWTVAGDGEYQYGVTQMAFRFGSKVESEPDEASSPVRVFSDAYWLIDREDESNNMRLTGVKGDKYVRRQETNAFTIIGAGTHLNYGTQLGREGTLTVSVRESAGMGASAMMDKLESLFRLRRWLHLRTPFGKMIPIAMTEMGFQHMAGVGNAEYGDLDIPYIEVVPR